MSPVDEKIYAAWYVSRRFRLPFLVPVAVGAALWLYAGTLGYIRQRAQSDLERYRAEVRATVEKNKIPEQENAALLWQKAAEARNQWDEKKDGPHPFGIKVDWRDPEYSGEAGPVAAYLARNQEALAWAAKAASLDRALWPFDERGDGFPVARVWHASRPCGVALLFAAANGDWPTVEQMGRVCFRAADHAMQAPGYVNFSVARARETATIDYLLTIVQCWPESLNQEASNSLAAMLESRLGLPLPLARRLEESVVEDLIGFAQAGSGGGI